MEVNREQIGITMKQPHLPTASIHISTSETIWGLGAFQQVQKKIRARIFWTAEETLQWGLWYRPGVTPWDERVLKSPPLSLVCILYHIINTIAVSNAFQMILFKTNVGLWFCSVQI